MSSLSASSVRTRPEEPEDWAAIRRVNELAFKRWSEAELVDVLRAAGAVTLSMVAVVGAEAVGGDEFGRLGFGEDEASGGRFGPMGQRRFGLG